jgi:hypothetical protein
MRPIVYPRDRVRSAVRNPRRTRIEGDRPWCPPDRDSGANGPGLRVDDRDAVGQNANRSIPTVQADDKRDRHHGSGHHRARQSHKGPAPHPRPCPRLPVDFRQPGRKQPVHANRAVETLECERAEVVKADFV